MIVREARARDANAIALIMAAVAGEGVLGTEPPVDVQERSAQFRATIEGDGPAALWVLEDGARTVRTVGYGGVQARAAGVLSLAMAILPESRGLGGGRALLETILEHARSRGAHKVELEVWTDNARAISVYASAGFEVEGLRRDHYRRRDGRLRSTLLMAVRLPGR